MSILVGTVVSDGETPRQCWSIRRKTKTALKLIPAAKRWCIPLATFFLKPPSGEVQFTLLLKNGTSFALDSARGKTKYWNTKNQQRISLSSTVMMCLCDVYQCGRCRESRISVGQFKDTSFWSYWTKHEQLISPPTETETCFLGLEHLCCHWHMKWLKFWSQGKYFGID